MPIDKTGTTVFSNAEIAGLAAPRPMLLLSDGKDWIKNTPTGEYPFAQSVYKLYGKENEVENVHLQNEGHDYGINKRLAAYQFMAKHMRLKIENIRDKEGNVSEGQISILSKNELTYFTDHELASLIKGDDVYKVFLSLKNNKN